MSAATAPRSRPWVVAWICTIGATSYWLIRALPLPRSKRASPPRVAALALAPLPTGRFASAASESSCACGVCITIG
jgi:hypothetical protein